MRFQNPRQTPVRTKLFSPHFCGKKCPEKSSRKIPEKILQNLYDKNPPTHFCRLAGANGRCTAVLFRQVVGVGVSEMLPNVAYGNLVWSFLLTVENRFGLFLLTVPPVRKLVWSFLLMAPPPSGNCFWSCLLTVPPP